LDKKLAQKKHFPAVNWNDSFTKYDRQLEKYYTRENPTFPKYVKLFKKILQDERSLSEIVQLVGKDSLGEDAKVKLEVAKMIREDFLMQNSFTPHDYNCPIVKTFGMMRNICKFYELSIKAVSATSEDNKMDLARIKKALKKEYVSLTVMNRVAPSLPEEEIRVRLQKIHDEVVKGFQDLTAVI